MFWGKKPGIKFFLMELELPQTKPELFERR
jgi:hypothetical protein